MAYPECPTQPRNRARGVSAVRALTLADIEVLAEYLSTLAVR